MTCARDALLVTTITVNGQRAFFTCSTASSWVRLPARTITSWRDGADSVLAPIDRLVAVEWCRAWNVAPYGAARPADTRAPDEELESKKRRTKSYWQAWRARVSREIEVIDLDLLLGPGADREAWTERQRRLAWDRWNISNRLGDFPMDGN